VRMFSNALFLTLFTAWSEMDQGVPLWLVFLRYSVRISA
jgi:hypothetical protein